MDPISWGIISAILAYGFGAMTSGISEDQKEKDATENYEKQQEYIETERKQQLETLAENYETEKEDVNQNATLSEKQLNNSVTLAFDNLINNMSGLGESYNTQAMNNGQTKGNELSTMAASGTRSSSMAQAIELESAVNEAQLEQQERQQDQYYNYQINSLLNNIANESDNLQASRRSFEEGGTAYKKYNTSVTSVNNSYDNELTRLEDEYNDYMSQDAKNSRFLSGLFNTGTQAFSFLSSVDVSKINFNSFGSTGLTGELAGNWATKQWANYGSTSRSAVTGPSYNAVSNFFGSLFSSTGFSNQISYSNKRYWSTRN